METDDLFRGAQEAYAKGDFQKTELMCHKVLRADPSHSGAALLLGTACLRLGNQKDALKYMQQHLAEAPNSVVGNAAISNLYFKVARVSDARTHALRAINFRPDDPSLYAGYARDLTNAGLARESENVLDNALKGHSVDIAFVRGLAAFLIQANQRPLALRAFARAVALDSDVLAFWLAFGELRTMTHDFGDADRVRKAGRSLRSVFDRSDQIVGDFSRCAG